MKVTATVTNAAVRQMDTMHNKETACGQVKGNNGTKPQKRVPDYHNYTKESVIAVTIVSQKNVLFPELDWIHCPTWEDRPPPLMC